MYFCTQKNALQNEGRNKRIYTEKKCYMRPFFPSLDKICWILVTTDQNHDTCL